MQKRVRELFQNLASSADGQVMKIIDAGRSVQEVEADVMMQVQKVMTSSTMSHPLGSIPP